MFRKRFFLAVHFFSPEAELPFHFCFVSSSIKLGIEIQQDFHLLPFNINSPRSLFYPLPFSAFIFTLFMHQNVLLEWQRITERRQWQVICYNTEKKKWIKRCWLTQGHSEEHLLGKVLILLIKCPNYNRVQGIIPITTTLLSTQEKCRENSQFTREMSRVKSPEGLNYFYCANQGELVKINFHVYLGSLSYQLQEMDSGVLPNLGYILKGKKKSFEIVWLANLNSETPMGPSFPLVSVSMGWGSKTSNNEVSFPGLSLNTQGAVLGLPHLWRVQPNFPPLAPVQSHLWMEPWPTPTWCSPRPSNPSPKRQKKKPLEEPHFQPHIPAKLLHQRVCTHLFGSVVVKHQNRVWSLMGLRVLLVLGRRLWGGSWGEGFALCPAHHTFPGALLSTMQIVSWDTAALPQLFAIHCAHKSLW